MPDTSKHISDRELLESVKTQLQNFATKDDVRTIMQDELKGYATKDDLKAFATKDDLKAFATKDDFKSMESRIERKIDSLRKANTQHHLRTREDIGHLNKKFGDIQEGLKQAAGLV